MKKKKKNDRFALTILLSGVILVFMIITLMLSFGVVYFFIKAGIITGISGKELTPTLVLLVMSVNSLLLGAILAAITSSLALKPVNKIISQINRLALGDFKARLSFHGILSNHPTVKEVSESFNTMAEELEKTELLRSDFINNFSHEFKTPIVSIAGFAKLLKRGNLTEQQKAEYIDIIEAESLRLSAMATNVLNLTKYENQEILTNISQYNLSEQVRGSILSLEGKWTKKKIEFNLNFDEYMICANGDMMKQVWMNLIDNAIKFSPDYGVVNISIKDIGENYEVIIGNRGEDIPPEQQTRIFQKFYQADESHAAEGNGIGLAVVKGVIKLHGGSVSVKSERGITEFIVRIPKEQDSV